VINTFTWSCFQNFPAVVNQKPHSSLHVECPGHTAIAFPSLDSTNTPEITKEKFRFGWRKKHKLLYQ